MEAASYLQYVRLREHALGPLPPACPTDLEVPAFPSLAETQVCVNKCGVVRCGDIHARAQSCTNIAVNIV